MNIYSHPLCLNYLLSVVDAMSNSVELQWVSQPDVDDEWSGFSEYFSSRFHITHLHTYIHVLLYYPVGVHFF